MRLLPDEREKSENLLRSRHCEGRGFSRCHWVYWEGGEFQRCLSQNTTHTGSLMVTNDDQVMPFLRWKKGSDACLRFGQVFLCDKKLYHTT